MPAAPEFSATVFARDTAVLRELYADLFELEVTTDIGWFVSLRRPGATWEICVWDPDHEGVPAAARATAGSGTAALLCVVVDDVDAFAARARDIGADLLGEPIDEPWGQRHVFVQDPVGTVIDVVQVTVPDPAWLAANGIDPAIVPT